MGSALHYRTGQNVCSASCPIEHIDIPMDQIKEPPAGWPDIRGLHSLNFSRTKWLTGDAIEVSIAEYVRGLPRTLQDRIGLGIPGVNPEVWNQGPQGRDALNLAIMTPARRALARIKMTEYSIFPICSNRNHWVLVVLHKEQRPTGPDGKGEWSHVAQASVIDSYRDVARARLIDDRLQSWLGAAGGFTYSANYKRTVWSPLQKDGTSCGPRVYWNAKQLLDRLLEFYEAGLGYSEALWRDLSGWFNEEFVRSEMTGRCAWDAVRAMNYKARIAVECVNRVRETPRDPSRPAAGLMRPSNLNMEPEKRPVGTTPVSNPYWTPPTSSNLPQPNVDPETPASRVTPVPVSHQYPVAPSTAPADREIIVIPDDDTKSSPAFPGPQARPSLPAPPEAVVIPDDSPKSSPQSKGKGPASSSFRARPFPSAASKAVVIPEKSTKSSPQPKGEKPASATFHARPFPSAAPEVIVLSDEDDPSPATSAKRPGNQPRSNASASGSRKRPGDEVVGEEPGGERRAPSHGGGPVRYGRRRRW